MKKHFLYSNHYFLSVSRMEMLYRQFKSPYFFPLPKNVPIRFLYYTWFTSDVLDIGYILLPNWKFDVHYVKMWKHLVCSYWKVNGKFQLYYDGKEWTHSNQNDSRYAQITEISMELSPFFSQTHDTWLINMGYFAQIIISKRRLYTHALFRALKWFFYSENGSDSSFLCSFVVRGNNGKHFIHKIIKFQIYSWKGFNNMEREKRLYKNVMTIIISFAVVAAVKNSN